MPRSIMMDELHIQVSIPVRSTPAVQAAVRRRLVSNRFRRQVTPAIRVLFAELPSTATVRVRLVP